MTFRSLVRFLTSALVLVATPGLLAGCGVTGGPLVRTTQAFQRYTDSFDEAAPGGAAYDRPAADFGAVSSIGFFHAAREPGGFLEFVSLAFVGAENTFAATAFGPDSSVAESISVVTRDAGLELRAGQTSGFVAALSVMSREADLTRSTATTPTSFVSGRAFVVRPEVGLQVAINPYAGLMATVGYDLPVVKNDPILAGTYGPAAADGFGDDPIGAGQAGPVASFRLRLSCNC